MLWPPSKKLGELSPNTEISTAQRLCAFYIEDTNNTIKLIRTTIFTEHHCSLLTKEKDI